MRISQRAERIKPFMVMEVAKAAQAMAAKAAGTDQPMVFLNIGEPDFLAPPAVQEAATRAMANGLTSYTPALGIAPLREAISNWYLQRFGLHIDPARIAVTAGASAALQLVCLALVNPGDEVLMPDPSYPCNRNFVAAANGQAVLLPTGAQQRFQLSAEQVSQAWGDNTRGVLLASPSNPTGTSIAREALTQLAQTVRAKGGFTIVDEIYLGLNFDDAFSHSALGLEDGLGDDIISVNSFSKYFNMTGWRLGWLVLPPALVPVVERLAQHLFICASTISQYAALACFEPDTLAEYERRRGAFKDRRDYFIPQLNRLGLHVPVMPDGAFYAYANCQEACDKWGIAPSTADQPGGSWAFAFELMQRAGIAATPGLDFGGAHNHQFIRLTTASSMAQLQTAVARLEQVL